MLFEKSSIDLKFYTITIGSALNKLLSGVVGNFELNEKILENHFLKAAIFIILTIVFMKIHRLIGKSENIKLEKRSLDSKTDLLNLSGYILMVVYITIVSFFLLQGLPYFYTLTFGKSLLLFVSLVLSIVVIFCICLKLLNWVSLIFISYSKYVFLAPSLYILYRMHLFKIPLYIGLLILILFIFCIYIYPKDTSYASALIRNASSLLLLNLYKIVPLVLLFSLFFVANSILIISPASRFSNHRFYTHVMHIALFFMFTLLSQIFSSVTCCIFENSYSGKYASRTNIFKTAISQFRNFLILSFILSFVEFLRISWKIGYDLIVEYNLSFPYSIVPYVIGYFLISCLVFQLTGLFTHFACFISIFKRRLDLITLKLVAKINMSHKFILFKCLMVEIWAPLAFSSLLSGIYNSVLGFEIPFSADLTDFRGFLVLLEGSGGFESTILLFFAFFAAIAAKLFINTFISSAMFYINGKLIVQNSDPDLSMDQNWKFGQ